MQEILCVIRLIIKIVSVIIYILAFVQSLREKRRGDYLEGLYYLGWAILCYIASICL